MLPIEVILELTWIPLIAFAMSFVAGLHMLLTKRRPMYLKTRGDNRPLQDETRYAKVGGLLLLFLAAGAIGMCVLLFFNVILAFAEVVVVFVIFAILWRRMSVKYGPLGY